MIWPLASCPVCTANTVAHGWWMLSATVLGLSVVLAVVMAWSDKRSAGTQDTAPGSHTQR